MSFSSILTKFGQDIGVGPVTLDDRDSCYLRFDQHTIVLEQIPSEDTLFIYTSFPEPSVEDQTEYFEKLLTSNHFGQGSGHAWFSFNPDTKEVFLMTRINSGAMEYDDFVLTLESFLNSIDHAILFLDSLTIQKQSNTQQNMHLKNPFA